MYIEYIRPNRIADPDITDYKPKATTYRPTWLVRTLDWEKVPGHEAIDGYHTLSYVWEQSGEMIKEDDGEYRIYDNGDHQITTTTIVEEQEDGNPELVTSTQHVTYDELVQQVCKDFDIKYLWYDKICINQLSRAEKHEEIKQMHLIYSNACFTLALIPEINIDNSDAFIARNPASDCRHAKNMAMCQMFDSRWWQRSWTLEELMMSTQIVLVGRNAHVWSLSSTQQSIMKEHDMLAQSFLGFKDKKARSVNQVLFQAHLRTSAKEHDKIYALANTLHGIIDIDIHYDMDIPTVLNSFYRKVAEHDLSIMCFGSILSVHGTPAYTRTMSDYNLPSWTGVTGIHFLNPITNIALENGYHIDEKMQLHMKCRSYTIQPIKYDYFVQYMEDIRIAHNNCQRHITSMDDFDSEQDALYWSQWSFLSVTDCVPNYYWEPPSATLGISEPIVPLSLTENCDECIILSIIFAAAVKRSDIDGPDEFVNGYFAPIVKLDTDGSTYRAIGTIYLRGLQQISEPDFNPQNFMDQLFSDPSCEARDFCIKSMTFYLDYRADLYIYICSGKNVQSSDPRILYA